MDHLIRRIALLDPDLAEDVRAELRRRAPGRASPEDIPPGPDVHALPSSRALELRTTSGRWQLQIADDAVRLIFPGSQPGEWTSLAAFVGGHREGGRTTWTDILAWEASHVDHDEGPPHPVPAILVEGAEIQPGDIVDVSAWHTAPADDTWDTVDALRVSIWADDTGADLGVWDVEHRPFQRLEVGSMIWPHTVNPIGPPLHASRIVSRLPRSSLALRQLAGLSAPDRRRLRERAEEAARVVRRGPAAGAPSTPQDREGGEGER